MVDRDDLPEYLWERPTARAQWDFPTAWLLGTQLLASLADILLSGLLKVDNRDWMVANTIDLTSRQTDDDDDPGEECCWIDFLADTGDSSRLVFQLAYLLQQPALEVYQPIGADRIHHQRTLDRPLPRGCALIVGGDTAYPIATRDRLVERIRAPFLWARRALNGRAAPAVPPVKLLAIPGNHDYYDGLDGFQRQFRPAVNAPPSGPRLDLPGYALEQSASYVAVDLPCGWQLLALDIEKPRLPRELSKLDPRQRDYFRAEIAKQPCKNRILVTSRPAVVYQCVSEDGEELAEILGTLGLPAPFMDGAAPLAADELRLDLSGDTHLYERYWGTTVALPSLPRATAHEASPAPDPASPPCHEPTPPRETWDGSTRLGNETTRRDVAESRANYASIVSGLGGAFHHPGQVRLGTITPQCAWPPAENSAKAVGKHLLWPRKVFQAGTVGVIGIAVSVLCFAMAWPRRPDNLLDLPFLLPRFPPAMRTSLVHLAAVASFAVVVVLLIAAIYGARELSHLLAEPIGDREPRRGWSWSWLTYAATHNRVSFWCLRWLGGNRRTSWRILITAPAWGPLIGFEVAAIWALGHCAYFARAGDGYAAIYIATSIIVLAACAVAIFVGGSGLGLGRIPLALFGLAIGALIVWTPYGWMRVISQGTWHSALAFGLFALYVPIRRLVLRSGFSCANTHLRRGLTIAAFLALAAYYVLVPRGYADATRPLSHPVLGAAAAVFFGAYFSSLWAGWYLYVCLQFNVHGNEAGAAARVVQFAEFLRIKLRADRAEVFVIAAEGPPPTARDDVPVRARLVDHFVIAKPAPPSRGGQA